MFNWLSTILLSYFFFSLSFFGDKLMLGGTKAPGRPADPSGGISPMAYTFYIGALGSLAVVLIPFVGFVVPGSWPMAWMLLTSLTFVLAVYTMFSALEKFEVSKVIPAIGACQPILIFLFTWLLFGPQPLNAQYLAAFAMLLLGSVLISLETSLRISLRYVFLVLVASVLFSLNYVFSKKVFLTVPFLPAIIWMNAFNFLFVIFFLASKKARQRIFGKQSRPGKKTAFYFFFSQSMGAVGGLLQNFAISLAPVGYLAIMNSLRGVQYAFLLVITMAFSFFFPAVFMENLSRKIIIQKAVSVLLIMAGLWILVW